MAFVGAVLCVCVLLGLSIYFNIQGREGLRWLCFSLAVVLPWFLGMALGRLGPESQVSDGDTEYFEVDVPECTHEPDCFQPAQGDEAKRGTSNG
jgi:hypothetical protein